MAFCDKNITYQIQIVFLDQEPLTNRRKKAFEIDSLCNENFVVEFWNLSEYCFGKVDIVGTLHEDYVRKIDSFQEFKTALKSIDIANTIFVIEGYLAAIKPNLNNYLIRKKAYTVRYELNTTAALDKSSSPIKRILNLTKKQQILLPLTVAKVLYTKFKNKFNKPYTHIISTGNIYPCDININHSDYVLYLESLRRERMVQEDYILFLDQFYPFHPDLQSHGINIVRNAEPFFRDLNQFFDILEQKYNTKVVIAAHPKAKYKKTIFNDRDLYYGKSNDLVKDARAVITIDSASISFVISHHKPLLLITSNDRLNTPQLEENNKYQKRLAKTIGTSVINISNVQQNQITIPEFSDEQRNNYIYKYMTSRGIENNLNTDLLPQVYKQILSQQ